MKDECLRAQETLSEASDGIAVSAEALRDAKAHCAACNECLAYVSALAALKKTPLPSAPEGVADRAISAVHLEAEQIEADEVAAAALLAAQSEPLGENADPDDVDVAALLAAEPRQDLGAYSWKAWAPYAAAAAVVLVIAGFAVMQGARFIAGSDEAARSDVAPSSTGAAPPYEVESNAGEGTITGQDSQEGAENAAYVDYGGWAYRFARRRSSASNATTSGVVITALDTDESPTQHQAFAGSTASTLLILDDNGRYLEFERVTRSAQGRTYVMLTRPIPSYGMWPMPPIGMQMPTEADGSPVFKASITDDHGQRMYVPETNTQSDGFAIAPETPSRDPAEGNPNWTWWQPTP